MPFLMQSGTSEFGVVVEMVFDPFVVGKRAFRPWRRTSDAKVLCAGASAPDGNGTSW